MNLLNEINKNVKLSALIKIIESFNYDDSSKFILNDSGKLKLPLENRIIDIYEMVYKKLKLDKIKNKKILDFGSGFCHNNLICKVLGHTCHNVERPPKEHIVGHVSNLYKYFHKILKIKNVEYYEITSPIIKLKNSIKYDYIFILNPTFNERDVGGSLNIWGVEDWKLFFKCLHKNLKPKGKIIIGWVKGKISDNSFNSNWNSYKNNKMLKFIENKYIEYFTNNNDYKVLTYTDLNNL